MSLLFKRMFMDWKFMIDSLKRLLDFLGMERLFLNRPV
ncbi:hypothetical protein LEP1GSC132_4071 [Leptospira kirschneri str. 200803703]|nr:hypothetical protein LEP1GSC064_1872 [Leptospira kirschneri serovar Grippotyphosa str. Moskva]EKR07207.1 hypothetical protein LEP1GSC122_2508 [Leptospira kirschneri serovar Valbuzzi str. 200702274]EMK19502.1 hypothetical protein LEP1GSC042_0865 [Leptospira kirschneri serovar Bim str. PUO 1247]EMN03310.1 hypothetical protein LEP1GSC046_3150 [Leptospira kirschneri serovar Bim str. 1051]EMO68971.1 hypothetical protein LEP1GSC132_4071 [Leptospira kirschneri str. 200803703]EPG48126.1 hypothetica